MGKKSDFESIQLDTYYFALSSRGNSFERS